MDLINLTNNFRARLLSLGYGDERAHALTGIHWDLWRGALKLQRASECHGHGDDVLIGVYESSRYWRLEKMRTSPSPNDLMINEDDNKVLMSCWTNFIDALSSVPASENGYLHLVLMDVELGTALTGRLLKAFKTAPLFSLTVCNNGEDTVRFAIRALEIIETIRELRIDGNRIDSRDAPSLAKALAKKKRVRSLSMQKCGIGQRADVMAALVPAFKCVKRIFLCGNSIGPGGASLIAKLIADNCELELLDLRDNSLKDDDAFVIANALKTNTKLGDLELAGNAITQAGITELSLAIGGTYSAGLAGFEILNEVVDSNHTCRIIDDFGCFFVVGGVRINDFLDPLMNKKMKLLWAILGHIDFLEDLPIELMPRVLAFVKEQGLMQKMLDTVFNVMREWSLPMLCASRRA